MDEALIDVVPDNPLCMIEYPGTVENLDRAMETLGGRVSITNSMREEDSGTLTLRYRPDATFQHPIHGRVLKTNQLLLRMKRQKATGKVVDASVVGTIDATVRFRSMADFQFTPRVTKPIDALVNALASFDTDSMAQFQVDPDMRVKKNVAATELGLIPPPSFSRVETFLPYAFKQAANVMKVIEPSSSGDPTMEPTVKLVNRAVRYRFIAHFVSHRDETIPCSPPDAIAAHRRDFDDSWGPRLEEAFLRRPIWSRAALLHDLQMSEKDFKRTVPLFAYNLTSGPWRGMWVRLGFDPRNHPEARFYQLLECRVAVPSVTRHHTRPQRLENVPDHVFRGTIHMSAEQMASQTVISSWYQLCDIEESTTVTLIQEGSTRMECDDRDGWFAPGVLQSLRLLLRAFVRANGSNDVVFDGETCDSATESGRQKLLDKVRQVRQQMQAIASSSSSSLKPKDCALSAKKKQAQLDYNVDALMQEWIQTRREKQDDGEEHDFTQVNVRLADDLEAADFEGDDLLDDGMEYELLDIPEDSDNDDI